MRAKEYKCGWSAWVRNVHPDFSPQVYPFCFCFLGLFCLFVLFVFEAESWLCSSGCPWTKVKETPTFIFLAMCTQIWIQRTALGVGLLVTYTLSFSFFFFFSFLRQAVTTLELTKWVRISWLVSEPERHYWLLFPVLEIARARYCTWLSLLPHGFWEPIELLSTFPAELFTQPRSLVLNVYYFVV